MDLETAKDYREQLHLLIELWPLLILFDERNFSENTNLNNPFIRFSSLHCTGRFNPLRDEESRKYKQFHPNTLLALAANEPKNISGVSRVTR